MLESRVNGLRATPVAIEWHSGLPIFACEAFLRAVGDEYGWIGGIDNSGELRCILPYTVIRRLGFRMVRFRIETIPLQGDLSLEEERGFLNSAIEYLRSLRADMIIPGSNTALFRTYPYAAVAAPYGSFIKDLTLSEEILFQEMDAGCRKNIRRATRSCVRIKSGMEYLSLAYGIAKGTMARSGARFKSFNEFERLALALGAHAKVFIAEHEGAVQACLVSAFSQHTAYTLYGGTVSAPIEGAMHLLHWEAMRQFREIGVKRFNFTGVRINPEPGSKQEGIRTFKMRFGGQLVQGYMWKYSFDALKFGAYSIAIRLLSGGDIVDREHQKLVSEPVAG
jgi:hypothetical protein